MSRIGLLAWRACWALPMLYLSHLCLEAFDVEKLMAMQEPLLASGEIRWGDNNAVPILKEFWHVEFLDELWRRFTITFAPSTLGMDSASSWQAFSFLNDLGPLFTIWILESSRVGNTYSPAWLPTTFAFAGQILGLGTMAPLFYMLCILFTPSSSQLMSKTKPAEWRRVKCSDTSPLLLPLLLCLHTFQLYSAYCAPQLSTRHFWTWAWQMTPLYLGVANTSLAVVVSAIPSLSRSLRPLASHYVLLGVPALISTGIWIYMLISSPHSAPSLLVPLASPQNTLESLLRRLFQFDQLCVFGSSFLWMAYHLIDLYLAGHLSTGEILSSFGLLPIVIGLGGPGAGLSYLWFWRESKLQA